MSEELGDLVVFDDKLGHPVSTSSVRRKVMVMNNKECFYLQQPLASIHTDIQYKEHNYYWKILKEYDLENYTELYSGTRDAQVWWWTVHLGLVDMDQDFIDNFNSNTTMTRTVKMEEQVPYDNGNYKYSKSGLKGEICFNSGTAELKRMDHQSHCSRST